MVTQVVVVLDSIGALFFLISFVFAMKNYKHTKNISSYWLIYAIASFIAFLWAGLVALEWVGFFPEILDVVQQSIIASAATAFAIASLLTLLELVKPTGGSTKGKNSY